MMERSGTRDGSIPYLVLMDQDPGGHKHTYPQHYKYTIINIVNYASTVTRINDNIKDRPDLENGSFFLIYVYKLFFFVV
jgi:hypothetical protein